MRDLLFGKGSTLEEISSAYSPILAALVVLFLLFFLLRLFIKVSTAIGDYLDQRNYLGMAIARRSKGGKPYRYPPRPRTSLARVFLVFGFVAVSIVILVVWVLYGVSASGPLP